MIRLVKWMLVPALSLNLALAQQSTDELYRAAAQGSKPALQQLTTLADGGEPAAQAWLGVIYANGEGVPKDARLAVQWFRKAAERGEAAAQNSLGMMLAQGEGVPQDYAEALNWYRKSAEQGNPDGQFSLGWSYQNGKGVPKDDAQAVDWYSKAAHQGHALALKNLERMSQKHFIPLEQHGGVYSVSVLINGAITLRFVVDSGASDVSIPNDVVTTLIRAGTISRSDFVGNRNYTLADGSTKARATFRIRSLRLGDVVLENVLGSVAETNGPLLLGQSFLRLFKSWSIDNTRPALVIE